MKPLPRQPKLAPRVTSQKNQVEPFQATFTEGDLHRLVPLRDASVVPNDVDAARFSL